MQHHGDKDKRFEPPKQISSTNSALPGTAAINHMMRSLPVPLINDIKDFLAEMSRDSSVAFEAAPRMIKAKKLLDRINRV